MKLYLITKTDDNGDNNDAFVWANDPEQAVQLYQPEWGELNDDDHVFEVPITPPDAPVLLNWHVEVLDVR